MCPSASFSIAHKAGTEPAVGDSLRAVTPSQLQARHTVSAGRDERATTLKHSHFSKERTAWPRHRLGETEGCSCIFAEAAFCYTTQKCRVLSLFK